MILKVISLGILSLNRKNLNKLGVFLKFQLQFPTNLQLNVSFKSFLSCMDVQPWYRRASERGYFSSITIFFFNMSMLSIKIVKYLFFLTLFQCVVQSSFHVLQLLCISVQIRPKFQADGQQLSNYVKDPQKGDLQQPDMKFLSSQKIQTLRKDFLLSFYN